MNQVTTLTIFKISGWRNKIFALKRMADFVSRSRITKGLEFIKLLGSGSKDGFSVIPDFGQYILICIWHNEDDANDYFKNSTLFRDYLEHSTSYQTIFMKATMSHGLWGGRNPFDVNPSLHNEDKKVAVLTRATIRWKDMLRFWKNVPQVSLSLRNGIQPLFAAGVGELPFRYQATFSIWDNSETMKTFAYKTKAHMDMIAKTRKVGWYSEELFARFYPYASVGDELIKNIRS